MNAPWRAGYQQLLMRDPRFDVVMSEPALISLDVEAKDADDLLTELSRLAND